MTPQALAQIRRWMTLLATDVTAPAWTPVVRCSTPETLRRAARWLVEHGHAPGMNADMVGILLAMFMIDVPAEALDAAAVFFPQDAAEGRSREWRGTPAPSPRGNTVLRGCSWGRRAFDRQGGLWNKSTMPARLQVLLAAICFGTTGTAQAVGPAASPVAVGAARIVFGGLLLALVARGLRVRLPRVGAPLIGMALAVAVYQLSFFAAIRLTGVAVGTVVAIGTGPAAAGALGRLLNGERLSARWAQATALAALGVVLLAGDGGASVDPTGVALAVTSGVGYASYTVLSKRMLEAGEAPEGVMAAGFGGAGLLLLPVLLAAGPGFLATPGGLALAVYLAAVPTALAYVLFSRGLRRLSSGETATLVLAEPLTASALGVVALGEHPSAVAGAGALLVLAGLLVLAAPARRRVAVAAVPA